MGAVGTRPLEFCSRSASSAASSLACSTSSRRRRSDAATTPLTDVPVSSATSCTVARSRSGTLIESLA